MTDVKTAESRAERLRQAFDQGFAEAPLDIRADLVALLSVVIRGEPYGVHLGEVGALLTDRRVVPLPGPARELLGVTGVRGAVVPVYDLGALLGHPPAEAPSRFLLVARAEHAVGFAVDHFDGYVQVSRGEITPGPREAPRAHCGDVARIAGRSRAVISLHSVMNTIMQRVAALRPPGER